MIHPFSRSGSYVIAITLMVFLAFSSSGQKREKRPRKVAWHDWYDSAAFFQGPRPLINGYGGLSDSLSNVHDGLLLYEHQGKYYPINNLADYYYWFTRKYEFLFRKDISLYEELYYDGDSFGLARYVSKNYKGKKLPVKFRFPNNPYIPPSDNPIIPDSGGPPTVTRFKNR